MLSGVFVFTTGVLSGANAYLQSALLAATHSLPKAPIDTLMCCGWSWLEARVMQTRLVYVELVTSQVASPMRTALLLTVPLNPLPVIVTRVPPAWEPVLGDTAVMLGFKTN